MAKYFKWSKGAQMFLVNNFQLFKEDNHEEGDALWRAGIAYICLPTQRIRNGILRAFRMTPKGKYQACRCNPRIREDDVSRDQIIMALTSLWFNNDFKQLDEIVSKLPYKLSKKFNMTPNLWLWLRGLTGNKWADYVNQFYMLIELSIGVLLNKFIKSQLKQKEYSQARLDYIQEVNGIERLRGSVLTNKWKEFLWAIEFPGYATHLAAWMVYTSRDSKIKPLLHKLLLADADSNNYLIQLLCGKYVSNKQIDSYLPMEEWRWSQRMTELTRTRLVPKNNQDAYIFDKMILKRIKNKQLNNNYED